VVLFNAGTNTTQVSVDWRSIGTFNSAHVRDLWQHTDMGVVSQHFSTEVGPHAAVMLRLSPVQGDVLHNLC
jgi:hypothetical protein